MTDTVPVVSIEGAIKDRQDLLDKIEFINKGYEELIAKVLTPEIKEQLDQIEAERKEAVAGYQEPLDALETSIKEAVIRLGATVKVEGVAQAIYFDGRESADMKMLKGYILAHPEAEGLIKKGDPYVSFRKA